MTSKFEMNTLTEIAVLNVAVNRILTHLARISPDPHSFLAAELQEGLNSLAKTHYWTVSPSYSTRYWKAKELMAFTGSFGDKSWSRNSII